MGVAYYVMLENEDNEIDIDMSGKGIAKDVELLDRIAKDMAIIPLSDFYSMDEESFLNLLDESDISMEMKDASWFNPKDGLKTVQSLLKYVTENDVKINKYTVTDLEDFERILKEAVSQNIKWHLAIDF